MKYFALLCMATVLLLVSSISAEAALQSGDIFTYTLGPGSKPAGLSGGRGGEFILSNGYRTFCIERNENTGNPMKVGSITTNAINGGIGGGNPDPLSSETAYLFSNFSKGILSEYSYDNTATSEFSNRNASATALQAAIWYFEDEFYNASEESILASAGAYYINLANSNANGSLYGVEVLNNLKGANYTNAAQDFLQHIPEATSVAVWSALSLMGFVGSRRSSRRT